MIQAELFASGCAFTSFVPPRIIKYLGWSLADVSGNDNISGIRALMSARSACFNGRLLGEKFILPSRSGQSCGAVFKILHLAFARYDHIIGILRVKQQFAALKNPE